jgi:hypothetical protein
MKNVAYLLLAVVMASCAKDPIAQFTVDQEKTTDESHVFRFENTSEDALDYEWDFGDGETSSQTNPTHIYNQQGVFTVTLTALNKKGESNVTTTGITVGELVVTEVTVNTSTFDGLMAILSQEDLNHECAQQPYHFSFNTGGISDTIPANATSTYLRGDNEWGLWVGSNVARFEMWLHRCSTFPIHPPEAEPLDYDALIDSGIMKQSVTLFPLIEEQWSGDAGSIEIVYSFDILYLGL